MKGKYSIVGKRMPVQDAREKATGEARFGIDLSLPNMLCGKMLGSPYPHAKILDIDASKAERIPGVKGVITWKDTLGKRIVLPSFKREFTEAIADEYPIAADKVRHIGETVAAVAAVDEDTAEEAIDMIRVEYEILPPVFDPIKAMEPGAPQLHKEWERNIAVKMDFCYGDPDQGFNESYYVREDEFRCHRVAWATAEPQGTIASFNPNTGDLVLRGSMQFLYFIRDFIAYLMDMPFQKVKVIHEYVGGGFGAKMEAKCHFCCALLSKKTGRPVKLFHTREEEFTQRHGKADMIISIKTGVKKNGELVAMDARTICDLGAYKGIGIINCLNGVELNALYKLPNLRFQGIGVFTNKPGTGDFRGVGNHQIYWVSELQMDYIARALGIDPLEMRIRNSLDAEQITPLDWKYPTCGLKDCLMKAGEGIGWTKGKDHIHGFNGLGTGAHSCFSAPTFSENPLRASVKLNGDGTVTLITVGNESGSGQYGAISQIVAEEMGIGYEDVKRRVGNTESNLIELGEHTGNHVQALGWAAMEATQKVKREILEVMAREFEVDVEDLEIKDRRVQVKGAPFRSISFTEASGKVLKEKGPLEREGRFYSESGKNYEKIFMTGKGAWSDTRSFGAAAAHVELDQETGIIKISDLAFAYDLGTCINPLSAEGQIQGGISCGIGNVIWEEIEMEDGQVMNPNFLDYKVMLATEIHKIKPIFVETFDPFGPFGAKELGTGVMISPGTAVLNAIYDATGLTIRDLPITPEKVLEMIERFQ